MPSKHNALQLPLHLSYKSSLVLLPPPSIQPPIESLRQKHDKQFHRWPPHINLIYPFLSNPSISNPISPSTPVLNDPATGTNTGKTVSPAIRNRISKALQPLGPFKFVLSASPPGVFHHGKKSATVWLDPKSGDTNPLYALQASLHAEFAECNADSRPFKPHLSIGQATGRAAAEELAEEAREIVQEFLRSNGRIDEERKGDVEPEEEKPDGLEWLVDRVYVIEREGFHDRFKVVGEIGLGSDSAESCETEQAAESAAQS